MNADGPTMVESDRTAVAERVERIDAPPPEGPGRRWRIALIAVVILPIVTSFVRAVRNDWFPIGDSAMLYTRAADVFGEHHPLLAAWTSASLAVGVDMNNPGAIYDLLLWPFAETLPPGPGAAIGVGALNIGSIIAIAMISRVIGGWRMQRWMLLAAAALSWSMGSEMLIDIWQAHSLLLPCLLFLVVMVGCAAGRALCVPWAVFVGSVLVQTHISYAYIIVAWVATAVAAGWFVHRPVKRASIAAAFRSRTAIVTGAVAVLLWFQPLYEQFFGEEEGNLSRLVRSSGGGEITLGLADATRITGTIYALPPWWARSGFSGTVQATPLTPGGTGPELVLSGLASTGVAALALVALTAVLAWLTVAVHRRSMVAATCAGAIATVSVPATVLALALLTIGPVGFSPHHVRWLWTVSVFITVVVAWLASELWLARRPAARAPADRRLIDVAAVTAIVALSFANLGYLAHPEGPVADYGSMATLRRVLPEVGALRGTDPVVYDVSNLRPFEPFSATVMMRMQELGIEFRLTDEAMLRHYGPSRRADGDESTTVFQLEGSDALGYQGDACTVALASSLTADDERDVAALADRLVGDVADGTVVIDTSRVGPGDPTDELDAARDGDTRAAWRLVVDGALYRWATDGVATHPDLDLAPAMERVGRWVVTSYGLFADGLASCPT